MFKYVQLALFNWTHVKFLFCKTWNECTVDHFETAKRIERQRKREKKRKAFRLDYMKPGFVFCLRIGHIINSFSVLIGGVVQMSTIKILMPESRVGVSPWKSFWGLTPTFHSLAHFCNDSRSEYHNYWWYHFLDLSRCRGDTLPHVTSKKQSYWSLHIETYHQMFAE